MAASAVSISGRLCPHSALTVECSNGIHQRNTFGGILGFIKDRQALGRRASQSSPAFALALVLSCSNSRSTRAAAVFATKQKPCGAVLDLDTDDYNVEDEDEDDEVDDEATEFADMEEWMRSKPPGFGLKEYDTSLEERLMAEIEAENAAKVSIPSKKKIKKPAKETQKQDAPPVGVEVYVGNLPKKRNVDRDLRAAFKSAQGLLHVRPIVEANEKTREPICKGLAFLTFASDNEAREFIRGYNGEDVRFGKTEKKVVCELAAVHSPFKKQLSQKHGTDSPRLQVRNTTPSSPPRPASSSSLGAVKRVDARDVSALENNLNSDNLEGQDEDVDSLDVSEDELLELEQEIWAELEDEDDFELDRELEGDGSEDPGIPLPVDIVLGSEAGSDVAHDRQENNVILEDEDEEAETSIQEAESGLRRGFGLTPNSIPAAAAGGDKDKIIQELESKLKQLEVQLKKSEINAKVRERTPQSEEKIEALEKRVLARAKSATKKDPKVNTAKRVVKSKKPSSKVRSLSKENPSRPKVGASKRLRKNEKKIYTGVLSKYSPAVKEVAL